MIYTNPVWKNPPIVNTQVPGYFKRRCLTRRSVVHYNKEFKSYVEPSCWLLNLLNFTCVYLITIIHHLQKSTAICLTHKKKRHNIHPTIFLPYTLLLFFSQLEKFFHMHHQDKYKNIIKWIDLWLSSSFSFYWCNIIKTNVLLMTCWNMRPPCAKKEIYLYIVNRA